jgi:rRNA maturation RNase YbeY
LGKKYNLSLSFISCSESEKLHREYMNKKGPANILSFPLDKTSGEIVMSLNQVRKEAKEFEHTYIEHILFVFIHGCLHLKGFSHGKEMEKMEDKYFLKFKNFIHK